MKVLVGRAEDVFNRADHVYGGVVLGDDGMMLYVRTNNIGRATVAIHVIAAILCVVFNNENEGARRVRAVNNLVEQQRDAISLSACSRSGVFTPSSAEPKLPI
jgi:hypothetical protein